MSISRATDWCRSSPAIATAIGTPVVRFLTEYFNTLGSIWKPTDSRPLWKVLPDLTSMMCWLRNFNEIYSLSTAKRMWERNVLGGNSLARLLNISYQKTKSIMKKYLVNVHHDLTITIEVEAENEQSACKLAEAQAELIDYDQESWGENGKQIENGWTCVCATSDVIDVDDKWLKQRNPAC